MLESGTYEVKSDEDVWGLHWALLSGKREAASSLTPDRQPTSAEGGSTSAEGSDSSVDGSTSLSDTPAAVAQGSAPFLDGSPRTVEGGSHPADNGATAADGSTAADDDKTNGAEGFAASADCGGASARGSATSFDSSTTRCSTTSAESSTASADGSAASADGGSKSAKARAGLTPPWHRQGTPSTGTELSREVTDNEECDSSDADSRGTRSTRTSLAEFLDSQGNVGGAVYSRRELLQLRPGGAPSAAARPCAVRPEPTPGPGPPRVAARPPTVKPSPPAAKPDKGGSGFFVSAPPLDEHTAVAASIFQAELVLEALLSEEPMGSGAGSGLLGPGGMIGSRPSLTTLMLRNIPNRCTRLLLTRQLDQMGFRGEYDLVYVPVDRLNKNNSLGYAFINFRDANASSRFAGRFHGASARELFPDSCSGKVLGICYAEVQGREAYLERSSYGASPRMGFSAEDLGRPRFFSADGWVMREAWPPWPWVMHGNQRISISDRLGGALPCHNHGHSEQSTTTDSLSAQWSPATFRPLPIRPSPGGGGRGKSLSAGAEAAGTAHGGSWGKSLALCAEAPEFVPTLASPESMAAQDLHMGMAEAFELPPAAAGLYPAEPAALRFPAHAEFAAPGVLGSSSWAVPGEMSNCNFWDPMEHAMPVGHSACYEGHDVQMMYTWPFTEFGVASA